MVTFYLLGPIWHVNSRQLSKSKNISNRRKCVDQNKTAVKISNHNRHGTPMRKEFQVFSKWTVHKHQSNRLKDICKWGVLWDTAIWPIWKKNLSRNNILEESVVLLFLKIKEKLAHLFPTLLRWINMEKWQNRGGKNLHWTEQFPIPIRFSPPKMIMKRKYSGQSLPMFQWEMKYEGECQLWSYLQTAKASYRSTMLCVSSRKKANTIEEIHFCSKWSKN